QHLHLREWRIGTEWNRNLGTTSITQHDLAARAKTLTYEHDGGINDGFVENVEIQCGAIRAQYAGVGGVGVQTVPDVEIALRGLDALLPLLENGHLAVQRDRYVAGLD